MNRHTILVGADQGGHIDEYILKSTGKVRLIRWSSYGVENSCIYEAFVIECTDDAWEELLDIFQK